MLLLNGIANGPSATSVDNICTFAYFFQTRFDFTPKMIKRSILGCSLEFTAFLSSFGNAFCRMSTDEVLHDMGTLYFPAFEILKKLHPGDARERIRILENLRIQLDAEQRLTSRIKK